MTLFLNIIQDYTFKIVHVDLQQTENNFNRCCIFISHITGKIPDSELVVYTKNL